MIKLSLLLILLFFSSCSLDKKSGIWTNEKKIIEENKSQKLFIDETLNTSEFNANLNIEFPSNIIINEFNTIDNNNGLVDYKGQLKNISKYKFSKISRFNEFDPEFIFTNEDIIFFDNKGSVIKFDNKSKLKWSKNNYTKAEKKLMPILFMANSVNNLFVADSLSNYYLINIENGETIWSKTHTSPFNSQVKIFKDKVFVADSENTLNCYSIKDGSKLWQLKTENSFINSPKKLSIVLKNNIVYFNNSLGDITAVDIDNGSLKWQISTQNSEIYEEIFNFKTSEIIAGHKSILFSNNKNEIYSVDQMSGTINWKQKVNSDLRPTLIGNVVLTISSEGYLYIIENETGNIIRVTDIFNSFKDKKRKEIKPIGFLVGINDIFLTTDKGSLLVIDKSTGKTKSIFKFSKGKLSRPLSSNQNMFIIKDNSIIKLN
ncbi:PQQ-like beta-propeller repeat protein [Candidatus Pelagibacter sp.]|nr:PQQ-like beta-propeller repeat protein [Candidatus Pelagibacter sp.]